MTWSLYEKDKFLEPLKFSNGKTQEDVVNETLKLIKDGCKVIFIKGVCGTGKSGIALNLAKELGKASVVVPGKTLQNQYKEDYEKKKYLLKNKHDRLKISVMTGRTNHKCKYLEDNQKILSFLKKEINAKLEEFTEGDVRILQKKDISANNSMLPCKIEIKEKNRDKINEYLKQNKHINPNEMIDIKDIKRASIAPACPYWSPVINEKYELNGKNFLNAKKRGYMGLNNNKFIFYERIKGCGFYEQFNSFIDADVIVFNSLKYKLESSMNRKPATEIEIIDECDEFLDSFSEQRTINIERLQNSLKNYYNFSADAKILAEMINRIINGIKNDLKIKEAVTSGEILELRKTEVGELLKLLIDNSEILVEFDEESYLFDVFETARMFEDFFDEAYLTFHKKENNLFAEIVTTNLAKRFKELLDKNKVIVLMSGTVHSENVLKNIFGIDNFKVLEAETEQQGRIEVKRTGMEMNCKYDNFSKGKYNRKDYLFALDKCVEIAKKPVLIHVNSFYDLPSEKEKKELVIKTLISREKLKENQEEDKTGKEIEKFKNGKIEVLFSTKCTRGIDFPGEKCNSIVFTKYPNPDVQSSFWKILKKTNPNYYWDFYKDKAKRELMQRIYRGLRFKEDHIYLLSPDNRVLEVFEKK